MITSMAFTLYPVTDITRAQRFYEQDLGLTVSRVLQDVWIEYALAGAPTPSQPLRKASSQVPIPAGIGFEIDNVDDMITALRAMGTTVKLEPFSMTVCRTAVTLNPEGNTLTLHSATQSW